MNIKSFIFLIFLLPYISSYCDSPQKAIFISLPSLSNRDQLTQLFRDISERTQSIDLFYKDKSTRKTYEFTEITYQLLYNNHNHRQQHISNDTVRVHLGSITLYAHIPYLISDQNDQQLWSGVIQARSFIDPTFFDKQLEIKDGWVEWRSIFVNRLTFTALWNLQNSRSFLPVQEKEILSKIFNNVLPSRNIRPQIEISINIMYMSLLKEYLNSQRLFTASDIAYQFNNIDFSLKHAIKDISIDLSNNGLIAYFLFGSNETKEQCRSILPQSFSVKEYGGSQEYFTIETIKNYINLALTKGILNVRVDSTWQVPSFQFYYGDFENAVSYASNFQALTPVTANCQIYNTSTISVFDSSHMYLETGYKCTIKGDKQSELLFIRMRLIMLVKLIAENTFLRTKIDKIYTRGIKYEPLIPEYKVDDEVVAAYLIESILNGTLNHKTFGSGIPLLSKKYPNLILTEQYLTIFDVVQSYN